MTAILYTSYTLHKTDLEVWKPILAGFLPGNISLQHKGIFAFSSFVLIYKSTDCVLVHTEKKKKITTNEVQIPQ